VNAEHLREQGIPDAAIRQALAGQPVSAAEHAMVTRWKAGGLGLRNLLKQLVSNDTFRFRNGTP